MSKKQRSMVFAWGLLWLCGGAMAGLLFLASATLDGTEWRANLALMVPLLTGGGGGGLVAWYALRSLTPAPSRSWRLPPAWALGGGFVLALAVGLGLWQADISRAFLLPILVAVAAVLPPLAAAGWALGREPAGLNARRGWTALGLGATAGTLLAYLLNALLSAAIVFLIAGLANRLLPLAGDTLDELFSGRLTEELLSPWFLALLAEAAVVAPLVEELVKPLALLPLLKRLDSAHDALRLGLLAGVGFAAVENLLYAALSGSAWGGVLAMRALGAALHPFGAGLMAVAWWGLLRRQPDAAAGWGRNYGLAAGAHAVWNGTCVVAAVVAGAWFQGWQVDLLGASDAAVLLGLLVAEGLGLLVALRAVVRRLEPADGRISQPGLPAERTLALWGLICLVVLLPVGLGVLRTIW